MLRRKAAFIAPAAGLLFLLRPGQQPPAGPVPPAGQRPPAAQAPPAPPLQPQQGGGGASPPAAGAAPLGPTLSASGGESRPTPEPSRPGPPPQPAPQGAGRHRGGPRRSGGGHGHGKSGECGNLHRLHGRPMLRWCLLKILHAEHPEATAADADRGRAAVAEARRKPVLWAAQAGAVAAVVRRRTAQQGLMGLCAVRLRWVPGHGGRDRLQLSRPANDSACGILFRFDAPRADKVARAPRPLCLLRVAGGSWTRLQFYAYGLASSLVAAAVGAITPLVARCAEELTEWPRHPTFCKLLAVHAALAGSAAFQRVLQVDLDAWFTDTAIAALRADQSMQQWLPAGGGWALAMQDDHPLDEPSTGCFAVQRSPWADRFLSDLWDEASAVGGDGCCWAGSTWEQLCWLHLLYRRANGSHRARYTRTCRPPVPGETAPWWGLRNQARLPRRDLAAHFVLDQQAAPSITSDRVTHFGGPCRTRGGAEFAPFSVLQCAVTQSWEPHYGEQRMFSSPPSTAQLAASPYGPPPSSAGWGGIHWVPWDAPVRLWTSSWHDWTMLGHRQAPPHLIFHTGGGEKYRRSKGSAPLPEELLRGWIAEGEGNAGTEHGLVDVTIHVRSRTRHFRGKEPVTLPRGRRR
eukprot:TRINITY_DN13665_c0_g1_i1.p1 TRINITY_DN13665_c0_g1~~TRINITY_DN13665_c0_g1_i1.p1  ORF type:complete len:669 (+),score=136.10 TRINITY_DN13665_c0_g1_i1:112-2007(+)